MSFREPMLLENDAFKSAIYLDPRYNVILSAKEKENAIEWLVALYCHASNLSKVLRTLLWFHQLKFLEMKRTNLKL